MVVNNLRHGARLIAAVTQERKARKAERSAGAQHELTS
jgi:hypothetical protein